LILNGGDDGDIGGAGAKSFSALRGYGEREIVLALQRTVRETTNQWRGVEILHDGDAEFAHVQGLARKQDYSRGQFCALRGFVV